MNEINMVPGFMEIVPKYSPQTPYKTLIGIPSAKGNLREIYFLDVGTGNG